LFHNSKAIFLCLTLASAAFLSATEAQAKRRFTIADEIGLTHFGDGAEGLQFSPDGKYFALLAKRGRLDLNVVEESLRFYRSQDIHNFLDVSQPPSPIWEIIRSKETEGAISDWRWLADSAGVAFIEHSSDEHQRLVLAEPREKTITSLTSSGENVKTFDVRDRHNYVYSVVDSTTAKTADEVQSAEVVGTGKTLYELLFPDNPRVRSLLSHRSHLWAVIDGKRVEVRHNDAPILYTEDLALSPDGKSVVTTLPVPDIPPSWETLFPPPYGTFSGVHAGRQNVELGVFSIRRYVRIDLQTGLTKILTDAPLPWQAIWGDAGYEPSWSSDGKAILLSAAFLPPKDDAPVQPCVAVVDLSSDTRNCVVIWNKPEKDLEGIWVRDARFVNGNKDRVLVKLIVIAHGGRSVEWAEYRPNGDGTWQLAAKTKNDPEQTDGDLKVTIKQGLNEPPLLMATLRGNSRAIWDPNPELKNLDTGQASVHTWKDQDGKERRGGLYKPTGYQPGQHYPLVIQTHGFSDSLFLPSGGLTTAFAARALAAAGIMVLQVQDVGNCGDGTPDEGLCNASGYEVVAKQLVSEGLVDPDKIALVGFSRTVYHVMQALTTKSSVHYRAASVTDGIMGSYFLYMLAEDEEQNNLAHEYDSLVGAPPFGEGLETWLKRASNFNLDKVGTPLLVVGEGPLSLLSMWEPYAGLRYLHKPVELIMLKTEEHELTNPAERLASQGGSVDWFRFWLQGYEDPDPAKADQNKRWRELRKLQAENDKNSAKSEAVSN
jgi:dipeptidyl aminopeptidase/acylaminoacyl peptidase